MALDETSAGLLVTFLILLAGFLAAKLGGSLIIAISKRKETINIRRIQLVKIYRYLVMILAIIIALLYLRKGVVGDVSIVGNFLQKTYQFLPNILLFALLIVLGIVVANLIAFILKRFFDTTGLTELMIEQNNPEALAAKIRPFIQLSNAEIDALRQRLRQIVVERHNLNQLAVTIVNQFLV